MAANEARRTPPSGRPHRGVCIRDEEALVRFGIPFRRRVCRPTSGSSRALSFTVAPRRDALSESLVPCYAADLVALSKVSRDGKDELQCLGHIMRQKRSSKITPMAFSSQSLASYLAENGHDIRQLTLLPFFTSRRYTTFAMASKKSAMPACHR